MGHLARDPVRAGTAAPGHAAYPGAQRTQATDPCMRTSISAGVLHVPSIKPVDAAAIAEAASAVPLVVTAEEHSVIGGLGGLVAEILGSRMPRRLERIGVEDTWGESAPNAWLLDRHGLTAERVAERVRSTLAARPLGATAG